MTTNLLPFYARLNANQKVARLHKKLARVDDQIGRLLKQKKLDDEKIGRLLSLQVAIAERIAMYDDPR